MSLTAKPLALDGVLLITPVVRSDSRGSFFEAWHADRYAELGLPTTFVQDNVSRSSYGTLRGMHLQEPFGQGKLVQALEGEILDVAIDVRVGSPTFGRWVGARLSAANQHQIYVPVGFAHGFCVVSPTAIVTYKCTTFYHPAAEMSVAWNDPSVGIEWPVDQPLLSEKDAKAPRLGDIPGDRLPRWRGE